MVNNALNFCSTLEYYNEKELKGDIKNFTQKMKLRGHFYDNNENQQAEEIFMDPVPLKHLLDQ